MSFNRAFRKTGPALLVAGLLFCSVTQADHGLFESNDALEISLAVKFSDLCRPREDDNCEYFPTTLEYKSETDGEGKIPVEVIVRGGWRAMESNCSVPLLFVRFDGSTTAGTPFNGQDVLPLTTHCGQGLSVERTRNRMRSSQFEQYLLKEYLAYRLYNLVSETSLRVRLLKISYPDPEKPSRVIRNYAFLAEHFDSLAARVDAEVLERWSFDHEKLDTRSADELALFQYMIGNTDWSIPRQRNILLLETAQGLQQAVPYDLDMSGLVNAHYAGPPPTLPIDEVTERYYLGFCHPDLDWAELVTKFTTLKTAVFDELDQIDGLNRSSRRVTRGFLQRFFETLESDKKRQARLVEHCQPWPPSKDDHMKVDP